MNKIIVVVGMCGVGKSVACDYIEKMGYKRIYFGAITFEKLQEEGLEVTPENERMMRERLRRDGGMGVFATLNLPKLEKLVTEANVVVESLYSWDELKIVKEKFGSQVITIGIVADKELRYKRLESRVERPFKKEEAIRRDITEIENIAKAGPIAYADYYIDNNGTIDEFHQKISDLLENLCKDE
mgnify:FL=1